MKLTCRKRNGRWVISRHRAIICKAIDYPHALRVMRSILGVAS